MTALTTSTRNSLNELMHSIDFAFAKTASFATAAPSFAFLTISSQQCLLIEYPLPGVDASFASKWSGRTSTALDVTSLPPLASSCPALTLLTCNAFLIYTVATRALDELGVGGLIERIRNR